VQVSVYLYTYIAVTLFLLWQHYSESCDVLSCQNERPPIPKDMPREYSDVVQRSWHREPRLRPEFSDDLPVLRELHEALSPGSKLSSASSVGSGSSTATVVSLVGHSSTRAQVLIWLDFFLCWRYVADCNVMACLFCAGVSECRSEHCTAAKSDF
jgi:hypothetical protein